MTCPHNPQIGNWEWCEEDYIIALELIAYELDEGIISPSQFMHQYKQAVAEQDFEFAKAISVSLPSSYNVADTHPHIKCLQNAKLHSQNYENKSRGRSASDCL